MGLALAVVTARARLTALRRSWSAELPSGEVGLCQEMRAPRVGLRCRRGRRRSDPSWPNWTGSRYWTFETAKCFTGRVVGPYVVDGIAKREWSSLGRAAGEDGRIHGLVRFPADL